MVYAPVVVFAYNRYNELMQVMQAISNNIDAEKTDVFVFSNAAIEEKEGDRAAVSKVREGLKEFAGAFHKYTIVEREKNTGVNDNMVPGIDEVIRQYGRVIVLEDDIVTAKNFILFMNQALDRYQGNQNVFSICGYNPVSMKSRLTGDTFFYDVFRSWGWATWLDRWATFDIEEETVSRIDLRKAHSEGLMYISPIRYDILSPQNGSLRYLDYRLACKEMAEGKTTVYSKTSLCDNIGLSGNGQSTPLDIKYENKNFDANNSGTDFSFTEDKLTIDTDSDYFFDFRESEFAMNVYYDVMFDRNFLNSITYSGIHYIYSHGGDLALYFRLNRIKSIAVYGWSDLGNYFYELLSEDVEIKYVIDRNAAIEDHRIKVCHELVDLEKVDAIVVTALRTFADIEKDLFGKTDALIISADDIVAETYKMVKQRLAYCNSNSASPKYQNIMSSNIKSTLGFKKVRVRESILMTKKHEKIIKLFSDINDQIYRIPCKDRTFLWCDEENQKYILGLTQLHNLNLGGILDFRQYSDFYDSYHSNKCYPILYPSKEVLGAIDCIVISTIKERSVVLEYLRKIGFCGKIIELVSEEICIEKMIESTEFSEDLLYKLNKINDKLFYYSKREIAVYCTGDHTRNLLKYTNLKNMKIKMYIDKNTEIFENRHVEEPTKEILEKNSVILISSFRYQEEIKNEIYGLTGKAEILTMYDAEDKSEFYRVYNCFSPDLKQEVEKEEYDRDTLCLSLEKRARNVTLNSDYYVTFSIYRDQDIQTPMLYRGERGVINAKDYERYNRKVAIVIQGPVIYEEDFTYNTIVLYQKIYFGCMIILSTWATEENKKEFEKFKSLGIEIVLCEEPQCSGPLNINFQLTSSYQGIIRAKEKRMEYVLKTRTDFRLYEESILSLLCKMVRNFPNANHPGGRLAVLNPQIEVPYYIPDYIMFGDIVEMEEFWDAEKLVVSNVEGDNPEQILFKRHFRSKHCYLEDALDHLREYFDLLCNEFIITDPYMYRYIWKKYTYEEYIQFRENPNIIKAADWMLRQMC